MESFWIFCRNLWHSSQTSIFVSRVKIPEEIIFLFFFSEFFRIWAKIFFKLLSKNFKKFSKLHSTCPEEQFVVWNFLKSFESFWIFCRNLWHGSQNSIFVSRVKIAEEKFFYSSFQSFIGFWAKNFSDFWPKNFRKFSELPSTFPGEKFVAWSFFTVLSRFGFSAKSFGMVLKLLSSCPE